MQPIEETVIMWGPTGAGKTSLFYAFLKKLERLSISSKDFFYQAINLQSGFPFDNNVGRDGIEATDVNIADELLSIKRLPKIKSPENELSSSFVHRVHVQDYAGSYSIAATRDHNKPLESDNFILALDKNRDFDYKKELDNLNLRLQGGDSDNKRIRIAVCVTKIDTWNFNVLVDERGKVLEDSDRIDELIIGNFNVAVKTALDMLAADNRFIVRKFLTSSAGFYYDNDEKAKRLPNYLTRQMETSEDAVGPQKWLKNEADWNPIGVADPFFWFFTLSEEEVRNNKKRNAFDALWSKEKVIYKPWLET